MSRMALLSTYYLSLVVEITEGGALGWGRLVMLRSLRITWRP